MKDWVRLLDASYEAHICKLDHKDCKVLADDIRALLREEEAAREEIAELKARDKERLELLIKKGEDSNRLFKIINNYRIGIDDLLNAPRPHADEGDVEAGNIMASLLSIKRTAHRTESKETEGKQQDGR